jgi:glycosyltransferase involved in cell wall biosynthesis
MTSARTGVSIVYITRRTQPRFEWFIDSFAAQLRGDEDVEVIFVDGKHSAERSAELAQAVRARFDFRHVPAKPTPYNGARRLTRFEYMAAASARNTGIVYATKPYVVFVDDVSVMMPGWWAAAHEAARQGCVVAGAYQKHWEMDVVAGVLVKSRVDPSGIDSRWPRGDNWRNVPIGGGELYGCSFGAPRALLLAVNGLDELCDTVGGEDYHLGIRLEWAGARIFYSRRMLTIESEELHRVNEPLRKLDKTATPDAYMRKLHEFDVEQRTVPGACDPSHMVLDILYGIRTTQALGNYYMLEELSAATLNTVAERFPQYHWFDGQPLAEL